MLNFKLCFALNKMEFQKTATNICPWHHSCPLPSSDILVTPCSKHFSGFLEYGQTSLPWPPTLSTPATQPFLLSLFPLAELVFPILLPNVLPLTLQISAPYMLPSRERLACPCHPLQYRLMHCHRTFFVALIETYIQLLPVQLAG